MGRNTISLVLALFVLEGQLLSGQRLRTEAECQPTFKRGERVMLTQGQFFAESAETGQYLIRDLYLIVQYPRHPLNERVRIYTKNTGLHPVTMAIERDMAGADPTGSFFLYGMFTMQSDSYELAVKPQKGDDFGPVYIGLATVNPCIIRDLRQFSGYNVRIVFLTAQGT